MSSKLIVGLSSIWDPTVDKGGVRGVKTFDTGVLLYDGTVLDAQVLGEVDVWEKKEPRGGGRGVFL